jgi:hypothetical protein
LFQNKRHSKKMGVPEIETLLSHLSVEGKVSASTQNQALSALLFLCQQILQQDLDSNINAIRAKAVPLNTPLLRPIGPRARSA